MLKLNTNNLSKTDFPTNKWKASSEKISEFLEKFKARKQDFYTIIDDTDTLESIKKFSQAATEKYDDIVVCGIGGSALGTITLRDTLGNFFTSKSPRLHVLENIDPDFLTEALDFVNLKKTLFIVISKSGGTPETLAQYFLVRETLNQANLTLSDHLVIITGPTGLLREEATAASITTFEVPERVGGRFSVLTSVGLLPAALIGIDVDALLAGAKSVRDSFLNNNFDQNISFQLAAIQFLAAQNGQTQNICMPYATKLRSFAAWFAQLLAESTGKINDQGDHVGLTPIPALGVTDQHSQLQLFAQGPNDKLTIFIKVNQFATNLEIPIPADLDHEKVNFLKGKNFNDLLTAEQQATADTLTEGGRPNITIEVSDLSAKTLGELFLLFEGATAFLGEFMNIDAFNQPGVERSKILTREYLGK
jgi:glucose-6-phosphate isomerase